LSTVETGDDRSADSGQELPASTTRRDGSRRRRISQDEEREIARLYADNSTSTAEIRQRFGIGDSSLYRVVQRHGVALRGHTGLSTRSKPSRAKPAAGTGSRLSAGAATPRTGAIDGWRYTSHRLPTGTDAGEWWLPRALQESSCPRSNCRARPHTSARSGRTPRRHRNRDLRQTELDRSPRQMQFAAVQCQDRNASWLLEQVRLGSTRVASAA